MRDIKARLGSSLLYLETFLKAFLTFILLSFRSCFTVGKLEAQKRSSSSGSLWMTPSYLTHLLVSWEARLSQRPAPFILAPILPGPLTCGVGSWRSPSSCLSQKRGRSFLSPKSQPLPVQTVPMSLVCLQGMRYPSIESLAEH